MVEEFGEGIPEASVDAEQNERTCSWVPDRVNLAHDATHFHKSFDVLHEREEFGPYVVCAGCKDRPAFVASRFWPPEEGDRGHKRCQRVREFDEGAALRSLCNVVFLFGRGH